MNFVIPFQIMPSLCAYAATVRISMHSSAFFDVSGMFIYFYRDSIHIFKSVTINEKKSKSDFVIIIVYS